MQSKSLERCCYICCAGAFGVFLRWLQNQTAFDDAGLADKSVFHVLVPLFIIAVAVVFFQFVNRDKNNYYYLPEDYCQALSNTGKLFTAARIAAGVLMCAGSLVLLAACETDKQASSLRILSVLGFLTGISFPFLLSAANRPVQRPRLLCMLAMFPVLMFAFWLITSYKMNAINSVIWSYAIEVVTAIIAMLAFFRIAGFAFGAPNGERSIFMSMLGAVMCLMSLADEKYFGMHIMLFAAAMMLILYNWILVKNLRQKEKKAAVQPEDGFDRL